MLSSIYLYNRIGANISKNDFHLDSSTTFIALLTLWRRQTFRTYVAMDYILLTDSHYIMIDGVPITQLARGSGGVTLDVQ